MYARLEFQILATYLIPPLQMWRAQSFASNIRNIYIYIYIYSWPVPFREVNRKNVISNLHLLPIRFMVGYVGRLLSSLFWWRTRRFS